MDKIQESFYARTPLEQDVHTERTMKQLADKVQPPSSLPPPAPSFTRFSLRKSDLISSDSSNSRTLIEVAPPLMRERACVFGRLSVPASARTTSASSTSICRLLISESGKTPPGATATYCSCHRRHRRRRRRRRRCCWCWCCCCCLSAGRMDERGGFATSARTATSPHFLGGGPLLT